MGAPRPPRRWLNRTPAALCLALYGLYLSAAVELRLVYQAQEPAFAAEWAQVARALRQAGGLVEQGAAFLSQLYYLPWAAALLLVAMGWLVCAGARTWIERLSGRRARFLPWAALLFLTYLHSQYLHPLSADLQLLLALGAAALWVRLPLVRPGRRLAGLLLAVAGLYWVGGGVAPLFALYVGADESRRPGCRWWAPAPLVAAGLLPWLAARWLDARAMAQAYADLSGLGGDPAALAAFLGLVAFPLAAALAVRVGDRWVRSRDAVAPAVAEPRSWLTAAVPLVALVAAGALVAHYSLDRDRRVLLRIDYLAAEGQWHRVLEEAHGVRAYNALAVYDINRALCHLDLLPRSMFSYPQRPADVFLPTPEAPANLKALSAILLEIGQVNIAEHLAHEALEIYGECPSVLQRLVLINVLKGRPEAARVFLGRLDRTLWHRGWARRTRQALERDPRLSGDRQLQEIRGLMVEEDAAGYFTPEVLLAQLLERNSANRMAFQYLVGQYLLTGQLERLAQQMARLADFPTAFEASGLPAHCEEAVLLYVLRRDGAQALGPDMGIFDRRIRASAVERLRQFQTLDAREAIERGYGSTYWYYFTFRLAPAAEPRART